MPRRSDSARKRPRSFKQNGASPAVAAVAAAAGESPGFALEMVNTKPLLETLSGIWNGKADQHAVIVVDSDGVTFKTHDLGWNFQGSANLPHTMFAHFVVDGDEQDADRAVKFKVNVSVLVKCLSIYGTSGVSGMTTQMEYSAEDAEFRMLLHSVSSSASSSSSSDGSGGGGGGGGNSNHVPIITECRIKTLSDCDDAADEQDRDLFDALGDVDTAGSVIVSSSALSDALCEIYSVPGAGTLNLFMSPTAPYLQLATQGSTGRCCVDFPNTSASVRKFEVSRPQRQSYQLSLIQGALKVLPSAEATHIQMSENGLLCFQHHLQHRGGESSYVEFVVLPEEDLDDASGSDREAEEEGDGDDSDAGSGDEILNRRTSARRRRAARTSSRGASGQVTDASALFDDDDDADEDNNDNGGDGEDDPFAFQGEDSDEASYDEHRRHSLLPNGSGSGGGSDSDDSVVPPSQSEGESEGEETSAEEEQEFA
jgi:cell cycle checkpoint protein